MRSNFQIHSWQKGGVLLPLVVLAVLVSGVVVGSIITQSRSQSRSRAAIDLCQGKSQSTCGAFPGCIWVSCPANPNLEGCKPLGEAATFAPVCDSGSPGQPATCSSITSAQVCSTTVGCYWQTCHSNPANEGCRAGGDGQGLVPVCDEDAGGSTGNRTGNGTASSCRAITTASQCGATVGCEWVSCPANPAKHGCWDSDIEVLLPVCDETGNGTTNTTGNRQADLSCSIRVTGRMPTAIGDSVRLCMRVYNYGEAEAAAPIGYTLKLDTEIYSAIDLVEHINDPIAGRGIYGRVSSREVCRTFTTNSASRIYTGVGTVDPENALPETNKNNNTCYTDVIEIPEPTTTPVPTSTVTPTIVPTSTPQPTPTVLPTATAVPIPTETPASPPAAAATPEPLASILASLPAGDRNNNCKVDSIDVSWFLEYYGKTVDTSRGRLTITPRLFAAMIGKFGTNICGE